MVVMIENVYPIRNKEETITGGNRKLPRNVRACGQSGGRFPVYMEDYVETYIRRLSETGFPACVAVVLVGQVMETEVGRCLFIRGGVNANKICDGDVPIFGEEIWNEVYEKIRLYFPDDEVVGWCIAGPGFRLLQEEIFLRAHIDNFADSEKVFLCYESLEKEMTVRICAEGGFHTLPGYYVYYEKNDEMQSYMIKDEALACYRRSETGKEPQKDGVAISNSEGKKESTDAEDGKRGFLHKDVVQLAAIAAMLVLIISAMVGTGVLPILKESVFANRKDVSQEEIASDEEKNQQATVPTRDPDAFAFGDFDFLDEADSVVNDESTKKNEVQKTEDELPEAEIHKTATVEGERTEAETTETDVNEETINEQTVAEVGPGRETLNPDLTESKEELAAAEETDDPNHIKEETTEVLAPTEYVAYIVKAGDTLEQICRTTYGSAELVYYICELNQLRDVDSIFIGQELILPKK